MGKYIIVTHFLPQNVNLESDAFLKNCSKMENSSKSCKKLNSLSYPASPPKNSFSLETINSIRLSSRKDHGALYSGILSVKDKFECLYVGWLDGYLVDNVLYDAYGLSDITRKRLSSLLNNFGLLPIYLESVLSSEHYDGFSKTRIWPLFHYVLWSPTDGRKEKQYWDSYVEVNQIFADEIIKVYKPGDKIWIHDYHFLLLPMMIRKKVPDAAIGFFLHCPFPSSEIFRCLPVREQILEGMLGSNLIGFHTYSYAKHFISSCVRVLGAESTPKGCEYRDFVSNVGIFPIGIDVKQVELYKNLHPAITTKINAIRELYSGKKIIIGKDKSDHIKGVIHKLHSFELFLKLYPEWHNKVVLFQVTSTSEHTTKKLEAKVSEMVSRINGKFGSLDFAPVHHYHHRIEKDEYYALLTVADLALITSVRDGMNTSSYEFVVCQKDNCGPLIISEFTGTAGCLSSAVLINPWDHVGVANAINESLTLTKEEKVVRHRHLYNYIENNTAEFWASSFLKELNLQNCPLPNNSTPLLDTELVRQHYRRSTKRLILLDYDGTLSPICKTPIEAAPTNNLIAALKALCADLDNNVYVISGRDQTTLESWLGSVPLLGMSAEHGCFLKYRETSKWINLSENFDFAWKDDVYQIFEYYTERTPGSFIENKKSSITWHYRLADPDFGSWQAKECQNHLENSVLCKFALEILQGKKNLEVRPQLLSKGVTVSKLCADICPDFVFCAGDDRTDEDMFKVLRKTSGEENNSSIFTCLVGKSSRRTNAFYYLKHPFDVIKFISTLSK